MSKEYRQRMGFSNKAEFISYLRAKDIKSPNWEIIEQRNNRIVEIFDAVIDSMPILFHKMHTVQDIVQNTTQIIRDNNILPQLNNHGRAMEDVYYTWLQGYLAELVFTPLIEKELGVSDIRRNGGDDLTDPSNFKRTAAADLISDSGKYLIDVQAGFSGGNGFDIKWHKVNEACKQSDYTSLVFYVDLVNGTYHLQNLNSLKEAEFLPNDRWEGQLCHFVSGDNFKKLLG